MPQVVTGLRVTSRATSTAQPRGIPESRRAASTIRNAANGTIADAAFATSMLPVVAYSARAQYHVPFA